MGTKISRIEKEFVLNNVSDKEIRVRLTGNTRETSGVLKSVENDGIRVELALPEADEFPIGTNMVAYFSYFGNVMTFNTTVRGVDKSTLRLDVPDEMYRDLSRKYARVSAPSDVSVSFSIYETKIQLNFPKSEEYRVIEAPELSSEFDPNNIQKLIADFRERTATAATINKIVMFRDKSPSTFEERVISQTGKALFIPDTSGRFPDSDQNGRIITRGMLLQADLGGDANHDRLPSMLAEKREKGLLAELFCPVLFHEYTIGYVYLAKDEEMEGSFGYDLLDYTDQFTKVLAYSLQLNGYFKGGVPETNEYQGEIIDISASGLLFANASPQLRELLSLYTDLDLILTVGDRKIRVAGRVMRKFVSDSMTFFGLQFMEMKPEDFRFLFEYVYGRVIQENDQELWEGGAEPPKLEF